jgi:glycosyltransferase involved in cell wall biosynthesis
MMEGELITIVVCTYNNAETLAFTLAHLAAQRDASDIHWDVLVVDNNCTDRTQEVVRGWMPTMSVPLRVITESLQGINPARVAGVRHSAGAWIAFIDDDCLLEPDWIRQAASFIDEHPDAGAFGGQVVLKFERTVPVYAEGYGYAFAETRLGDVALRRDWLAGAGMVLRRSAVAETGWLDGQFLDDRIGGRLVSGGDVELGLRIAEQFEIWYAPRCVLNHAIPMRRTERAYLRRLVFGLGRSSHDVAVLTWRAGARAWWGHALRRAWTLSAQGLRTAAKDLLWRRQAFDLPLSLAFAAGWMFAMLTFGSSDSSVRRDRMGRLALGRRPDPRVQGAGPGSQRA